MSFHPLFKTFGKLEIFETYETYDRPVLFSCRNNANTHYLVVLIEENNDNDVWMYAEVSLVRLNRIRTGIIDLHTAFTETETGSVWHIVVPINENELPISYNKQCSELTSDEVPLPGVVIAVAAHTAPILPDDLERRSIQQKRDITRFAFDFNATLATEAPVKPLGLIFTSIQDIVHSIASVLNAKFKGIVPQAIPVEHQLVYEASGAGSFEVQIASYTMSDLFGESDVGKAFEELLSVIDIRDNEEILQERLAGLKANVTSKYLIFLKHLRDYVSYTRIIWVSPNGARRQVALQKLTVEGIIRIIEKADQSYEENLEVEGILIGANIDNKTFDIKVAVDEKKTIDITGRVSEEGMKDLMYAQLSVRYHASIKKISTLHPMTGKVEERRELMSLKRIE